jgi:uncharacterized hydrophobic protein (TIGR00271 family)
MPDNNAITTKVLVPIANPATAAKLLQLGLALIQPEHGEVIGLFVLLGDLEQETKTLDALEPIVEKLRCEGCPLVLRTQKATNVARGILDAARDANADLLILGLRQHPHRQVVLGTIAENVLITAPCDIVIYRPSGEDAIQRVVVPADGSLSSRVACRLGAQLAERYAVVVEAMYVQESYYPRWEGLGRIEQSLEEVKDKERIRRTLITAHDPGEAILARVEENDLIVIGYSRRTRVERWLFGDLSQRMLERGRCSVIIVAHALSSEKPLGRVSRGLKRFQLQLTPAEREDILREAYDLSAADLDYFVLITISAALASLGLLLNSVAIIIGAMLVAPFMQPCIAVAVGITTGRFALVRRALIALSVGIPLALVVASLCGLLVRGRDPTSEMLARSTPTFLDVLVAFVSGLMGAYATARKEIPSALAGVAIAAALMPPLCTLGLELSEGRVNLGLHAGLLFLINITCISLAGWVVFYWVGMHLPLLENTDH